VTETNKPSALFWAGILLFLANLTAVFGNWSGAPMQVGMYGAIAETSHHFQRPSPFTERVETNVSRKVKAPVKLVPVAFQQDPATVSFELSAAYRSPTP
jgi:hypothetical protein